MPKIQSLFHKFFIPTLLIFASTPAKAQITPDNTLGAEASTITKKLGLKPRASSTAFLQLPDHLSKYVILSAICFFAVFQKRF
ncbi:hypothetical protein IQ278_38895, partial [Tolypothrix sp. LEGE 11397]|uniref:hypothetical protein n=1 Tax=Tolypothrix sp. LEGE 11397 TaxID=2777971 RepID=UPI00187E13BC